MSFWEIASSSLFQSSWLGLMLFAFPAAWIGTTLIEKRLSLITDTYSHALLPGVVISQIFFGTSLLSLILGAWLTGLLLAFLTFILTQKSSEFEESRFAFYSLLFVAIGMVLAYQFQSSSEILNLLFGNVLLFEPRLNFALFVLLILTLFLFVKKKSLWSLWVIDPTSLEQSPVALGRWSLVMIMISTLYLTLGLYGLGSLMLVGLLIVPPLIARQHFKKLKTRLKGSLVIAVVALTAGLFISFRWNLPIGPSLVLALGSLYILSALFLRQNKNVTTFSLLIVFSSLFSEISKAQMTTVFTTSPVLMDLSQSLTQNSNLKIEHLHAGHSHSHESQISPRSLLKLKKDSLIVYWGFGIDERVIRSLQQKHSTLNLCLASKNLRPGADAHHWTSAKLGVLIISNIESCLINFFPQESEVIKNNAKKLIRLVQDEGLKFEKALQSLGDKKRSLLVPHQAFSHLSHDYRIEIESLRHSDHHSEPSAQDVELLLRAARKKNITLFLSDQPHLSPLSKRLIELGNLKHQGHLYSDSLPAVSQGQSGYVQLLRSNFSTLIKAFKNQDVKNE